MRVMKFGGASVKDADAVRNVSRIIGQFLPHNRLVIVISAMDKTTNHLEKLAWLARDCREVDTWEQFGKIKGFHFGMIDQLFGMERSEVRSQVEGYFTEIERICRGILLLNEFPSRTYDRIVAFGELLSACILSHFLAQDGHKVALTDARQIVKTDASYSQASVIWSLTNDNLQKIVLPLFERHDVVVTQGFIASSTEGKVTTLGREGSDYTASIFAQGLGAESVTVWKDVEGILNGDPRIEANTVKLDALSYERAVEMTFYGASVIHPKTIKPIRNAGIPLYVKCFKDTALPGTVISAAGAESQDDSICIRVVKKGQALLRIQPLDFSFMEAPQINKIFSNAAHARLEISLVQTNAISLWVCATYNEAAIGEFQSLLLDEFSFTTQLGLVLKMFINYGESEWASVADAVLVQRAENKLLAVVVG
ncbi:MAG TPA: aspartate kinase [Bacteroidia bacterium]|nr:aspartate kinase [Bacteroidia bacterium]